MFCICAGSLQDVEVTDQTSILYEGIAQQFSWKNLALSFIFPAVIAMPCLLV